MSDGAIEWAEQLEPIALGVCAHRFIDEIKIEALGAAAPAIGDWPREAKARKGAGGLFDGRKDRLQRRGLRHERRGSVKRHAAIGGAHQGPRVGSWRAERRLHRLPRPNPMAKT